MKKMLILLLLCAPLALFAQTKDKGSKGKTTTVETKAKEKPLTKEQYNEKQERERAAKKTAKIESEWVFVEVVFQPSVGATSIKLDLANAKDIILDKNMSVDLNNAKARRYSSITELFNLMGSIGFEMVTSFPSQTRGLDEIHFVFKGANVEPVNNISVRGVGNTMSKENPGLNTKQK